MTSYVLDANILFSGILSRKPVYRALFSIYTFYPPDFAFIELEKYRALIQKKAGADTTQLKEFTLFIFSRLIVVPAYLISDATRGHAEELVKTIDPKDVAYVALAEELNATLLTRDQILHNGLVARGYRKVQLFESFIAEQIKLGLV
ncbi:PIN domain-containing protein [Nibrella saemangeumensis]|uniref:PIN domain-containing protein n=1 Tax=Nibrella saemangeumensis TaxID=1084526 RepID=A0ABP8MLK6_9BACT